MLNIKHKFLVGLIALLALIFIIGVIMIIQVKHLGSSIDVILRENYQSVVLCQRFNETLEKINEDFLRAFAGDAEIAAGSSDSRLEELEKIWKAERANVTVSGEKELVEQVAILLADYSRCIRRITSPNLSPEKRRALYGSVVYPQAANLRELANKILELNQNNMIIANNHARNAASHFYNRMLLVLFGCIAFAVCQMLFLQHWITKPIRKLTELTTEIAGGNLDIVLNSDSNDEIGQLSRAFNSMATALRKNRRTEQIKLKRSEQTNQDVFKELPTPIAVFDAYSGRVEIATQSADRHF